MFNKNKQQALERAILRFMPKKKRGFMAIGASCIVPTQLDKIYFPYRKMKILGYEITNQFGLVVICMPYPSAAYTYKIEVEHIYHSITEFVEKHFNEICIEQIANLRKAFVNDEIPNSAKKTAESTLRSLINIKHKVEIKIRKKNPPLIVDCRDLLIKM